MKGDDVITEINKIKKKINQIIKEEDLIYCEISYDDEGDNELDNIWLYELIVYDEEKRIEKFVSKLNKYANTTIYKNMDDGDYTIECIIKYKR